MNVSNGKSVLVNIGCGSVFHHEWLNFDKFPLNDSVIKCDISNISKYLAGNSVDMLYLSHVLEHIPRELLSITLETFFQILKPDGVIRIVVPDLEKLAREYLQIIEALSTGKDVAFEHQWIVAEMFDQCTRLEPGGRIKYILSDLGLHEREYIAQRVGTSVANAYAIPSKKNQNNIEIEDPCKEHRRKNFLSRFKYKFKGLLSSLSAKKIDYTLNGEKHMWMYDFYQLKGALIDAGFKCPVKHSFNTSNFPDFDAFCLDQDSNGLERKPDSVYVEAIKPPMI